MIEFLDGLPRAAFVHTRLKLFYFPGRVFSAIEEVNFGKTERCLIKYRSLFYMSDQNWLLHFHVDGAASLVEEVIGCLTRFPWERRDGLHFARLLFLLLLLLHLIKINLIKF